MKEQFKKNLIRKKVYKKGGITSLYSVLDGDRKYESALVHRDSALIARSPVLLTARESRYSYLRSGAQGSRLGSQIPGPTHCQRIHVFLFKIWCTRLLP